MRAVIKKNTQFIWGPEQTEAFEKVEQIISEAPTLAYYRHDQEVTLSADSSSLSILAVCLQAGKPLSMQPNHSLNARRGIAR